MPARTYRRQIHLNSKRRNAVLELGYTTRGHERFSGRPRHADIILALAAAHRKINLQPRDLVTDFEWLCFRIWLDAASDRPISQVQHSRLSNLGFVVPLNQRPATNRCGDQDAGCDGKQSALATKLIRFLKLRKITITRTARSQVIEPRLSLDEGHRMKRDALQDVRVRASDALGIREFTQ